MTTHQAYDINEAAAILKVKPGTLRLWIQQGLIRAARLPGLKGQGRYRITAEEISRILTPKGEVVGKRKNSG